MSMDNNELNNDEFKNNEIPEDFDKKQVEDFYEKSRAEAEEVLQDENKMERLFQRLEKKLKAVPVAGTALAYIPLMMSLVRSYVKKEYTELPVGTMVSIVIALIYFLSPVDVIPDFIPGLGMIDDAAIVAGCLILVKGDLEDYRYWRKANGHEYVDITDYEELEKEAAKANWLSNILFRKNVDGNK